MCSHLLRSKRRRRWSEWFDFDAGEGIIGVEVGVDGMGAGRKIVVGKSLGWALMAQWIHEEGLGSGYGLTS